MDSLTTFATNFRGGARAYLFEMFITPPEGVALLGYETRYFVKSTALPGSDINEIAVNWMGAEWKIPAVVRFHDWTVSFNVDRDFKLIKEFDIWRRKISDINAEKAAEMVHGSPGSILGDARIKLLSYGTDSTDFYGTVYNMWPKSIGDAALDYSSQDIMTFDVTFSYTHFYMEE